MMTIVMVEQAQAELDQLYADISVYTDKAAVAQLLVMLRNADEFLAEIRTLALSIDNDLEPCTRP